MSLLCRDNNNNDLSIHVIAFVKEIILLSRVKCDHSTVHTGNVYCTLLLSTVQNCVVQLQFESSVKHRL